MFNQKLVVQRRMTSPKPIPYLSPLSIENVHVSPELPAHLRCSAHKLNLCATTDAGVLRNQNTSLCKTHERVINKCNKLWNAAGRPKSAEIF